jgi:hypothetical protein
MVAATIGCSVTMMMAPRFDNGNYTIYMYVDVRVVNDEK